MLTTGESPARPVPRVLTIRIALNRLSVGEIGDRVVTTDREPRFVGLGQQIRTASQTAGRAASRSASFQEKKLSHGLPPGHTSRRSALPWPTDAASNMVRFVYGKVKPFAHPLTSMPRLKLRRKLLPEAETRRHSARGCGRFSRLMGEDETGTHQALGRLRRAVDPLIAAQADGSSAPRVTACWRIFRASSTR